MIALDAEAAAAVPVRPAATTLVLRQASDGIEVLMLRRSLQASFMPGSYVFPGGAVDPADAQPTSALDEPAERLEARMTRALARPGRGQAYAVAALRECFEECGLWLGHATAAPAAGWAALRRRVHAGEAMAALATDAGLRLGSSALQPWAHWVTPLGIPKRFDTAFFVCPAPQGQLAEVDAGETTTLAWVQAAPALEACAAGSFAMEFATIQVMRELAATCERHADRGPAALTSLLAEAAQRAERGALPVVEPRLQLDAGRQVVGIRLPEAGAPGA